MATVGSSYYVYHLEKAPITGRLRFINVDEETEKIVAQQSFQEIFDAQKHLLLPTIHPFSQKIRKIVQQLQDNVQELVPGMRPKFQVFVLDSPEPNAFVLPGGQIFVNLGLSNIAKNDDELATVLAHEIAHKIVRHGSEKLSTHQFFSLVISLSQFVLTGELHNPMANLIKNIALDLPFSRTCEKEADYIGLLLMAKSCFKPQYAIEFWKSMELNSSITNNFATTFLSTHPSHSNRIKLLKNWISQAEAIYQESGCENYNRFILFQKNKFI